MGYHTSTIPQDAGGAQGLHLSLKATGNEWLLEEGRSFRGGGSDKLALALENDPTYRLQQELLIKPRGSHTKEDM